jgi:hypothetical protein
MSDKWRYGAQLYVLEPLADVQEAITEAIQKVLRGELPGAISDDIHDAWKALETVRMNLNEVGEEIKAKRKKEGD